MFEFLPHLVVEVDWHRVTGILRATILHLNFVVGQNDTPLDQSMCIFNKIGFSAL